MRFSQQDIARFAEWSHDRNPLHVDAAYARRTFFGGSIAHGMLSVIDAIASAGETSAPVPRTLEIEFKGAIRPETTYVLDKVERSAGLDLSVRSGEAVLLTVRGGNDPVSDRIIDASPMSPAPPHRQAPRLEPIRRSDEDLDTALEMTGVHSTAPHIPDEYVRTGSLHPVQVRVLALCSYLVGMEVPGLNSLFTRASLHFAPSLSDSADLSYRLRVARYDRQFRMLETRVDISTADGRPVAAATLRSYVRFSPVVTEIDDLAARVTDGGRFRNKVALVCGGTRGLGADLSAALAVAGFHVYASFHRDRAAGDELVQRLAAHRVGVDLLEGDAADATWCRSTVETIIDRHGHLDLIVLNACAPPTPLRLDAATADRFGAYVTDNLALVQAPLAASLPALHESGGVVAYISSSFVDEAPAGFAHYVALKQAGESIVTGAAKEYDRVRALIVRPPRLRTSWNDTPTGVLGTIPADWVASHLVNRLADTLEPAAVGVLSEFPPFEARTSRATAAPFSLALSASFTTDLLLPGLRFWSRELGIDITTDTAPYGQILQTLLDPASVFAARPRGANVILLRVRDWLRELPAEAAASPEFVGRHLEQAVSDFERAIRTFCGRGANRTFLIVCPSGSSAGESGRTRRTDVDDVIAGAEQQLVARTHGLPGLRVVTAADFHTRYGVREAEIHDPLRDHIGHIPYRNGYYHVLAAILMRHVHRTIAPVRKVVAVDADNTLWRGVVGEVGADGVVFEAAHRELHRTLRELAAAGVLIALCSKNDEDDVWQVFETRHDFGLMRESIVGGAINWQPKSQNLRALAARLNLGIDSFIFIDDNPVECAEVRANCPEVLTLEWPQDSDAAIRLLQHTWELDVAPTSAEDARRTEMYREEFRRQELRDRALTLRDFLESLDLAVEIAALTSEDLPRASQLTLRTNQFNFTTRRRSEPELQALAATGRHDVRTIRVRDRFGDYGLVGLLVTERHDDRLDVDTFLLSCRVLGRGVEHRILADLGRRAQEQGVATVRLRVDFTKKNTPARQFLTAIALADRLVASERALEYDVAADDLAALQFEPADDPAAAGQVDIDDATASAGHAADGPGPRMREVQIVRAAAELSTLDALVSAIDGAEARTPAVAAVTDGQVDTVVYGAFADVLGITPAAVKAADHLDRLGCDSLKIVEITVALTASFPWLPPTLLFEHRTVSEIVSTIVALSRPATVPELRASADVHPPSTRADDAATADIAIVGMDLRCAGAGSPGELWTLLSGGRTAIAPVPADRPHFVRPLQDSRPHWAGLLDGIDSFDAEFFGVSPREGDVMDPQGRLLLQVAWGALEDAGCAGRDHDPETGVFVGVMYGDYGRAANNAAADPDSLYKCWEGFSIANRLSQTLDLRGPSLAVDTACSSSATALHLACRALTAGDCRVAIVGGINLILDPDRFAQLGRLGILSSTGRVDAFGADADGTVLGEGVGVVVLRPLREALARNDRIYGVIKGTGISTGNGTVGFTAPNPQAQADAIRRALAAARIDPRTIGYVETHGTGTSLGDPIEVRGLTLAYADAALHDPRIRGEQRCRIGSIKPNIGHLEAGAGIIGLIKVLLQLQHGTLVPSLTSARPNPHIPFSDVPFEIQRGLDAWTPAEFEIDGVRRIVPRRAGLSSFGVGGANAHVIIEEPPSALTAPPAIERPAHIVTLSARSDESLRRHAAAVAGTLREGAALPDVAYTLNTGRKHFDRRLAVVGATSGDVAATLVHAAEGTETPVCAYGVVSASKPPRKRAFLFTGQGSQYAEMGKALYETQPIFRDALDRCAAHLDTVLGRPLLGVLFAEPGSADAHLLDQTGFTQPALFGFQYALAQLWQSWGVHPDVVMGHSVGEIAALCVAGGVSLDGAVQLISARGRLMQALPAGGAMTSVMAPEARVLEAVAAWSDQVTVAAVNAPEQVVISGAAEAVAEIASQFDAQGIKTKPLTVSHAFHSPLMRPMIAEFQAVVEKIRFAEPRVPFVSGVTGELVTDDIMRPEYWVRQVLDPVRFTSAIAAVERSGASAYVEIGPHPVLLGMARQSIESEDRLWLPSLRKDADAWQTMLGSLAALYVDGAEVDWARFDAPYIRRRVSVPAYQFRQKRHWIARRQPDTGVSDRSRPALDADPGTAPRTYTVQWQRRDSAGRPAAAADTHWLIVADRGGVGRDLARVLEQRGASCTIVDAGASRAALARVWHDVARSRPVRAVHLGNLDQPIAETSAATQAGIASDAVQLVQIMAAADAPAGHHGIWLITRGAQSVDGESCVPSQAALWGLGRTIALETPELWGGLVDLPSNLRAPDVEALADLLLTPDVEDQIALRGCDVYVPRLVDSTDLGRSSTSHALSATGSYLITGGVGALGFHTARWLAGRGVRHLVLASRTPALTADAESVVSGLRGGGVTVRLEAADLSRPEDVERLIGRFGAEFPPLHGIVHAAGVDRRVPLRELSREDMLSVFAAKVDGARLLDRYTRDLPLETFVCFSSLASVLGAGGRAHYAAANAFLDALAFERRSRGAAALTLNWGPWTGGGMAGSDLLREFERIGNHGLNPSAAMTLMGQALGGTSPQVVVADVEWERFREAYEARRARPIVSTLHGRGKAADAPAATNGARREDPSAGASAHTGWVARLASMPATARMSALESLLRAEVASTLGFAGAEDLPLDASFYQLGMDSLMAAEVIGRLRKRVGISCTALVFDHPSIQTLTPRLLDALAEAISAAEGNAVPAGEPPQTDTAASPEGAGVSCGSDRRDAEVLAFQRQVFPDRDPELLIPRWRWMFVDSARRLGVKPRVWLHYEANRLVAHMGAIRARLKLGSRHQDSAWLVDSMVLEEYRTQAIGLRLIAQAHDDLPCSLSLGQGADVRQMLLRLGWTLVTPLQIAQLLIRPDHVLKRKLGGAGAWVAGLGLRAAAAARPRPSLAAADIREIPRFDDRHDRLWDVMAADLGCAVVRDASFLNWKYVDQPGQDYLRLELVEDGTPKGVAILLLREADDVYAYRRASLVDVIAPLNDRDTLRRVVTMAIDAAANAGADSLVCMHTNPQLTRALKACGFRLRTPQRFLLVDATKLDRDERVLMTSADSWHLTQGDSDIDRPGRGLA